MELHEIKRIMSESGVQYLLLQFTDVLGNLKGVEVGSSQLEQVLEQPIPMDASSVLGRYRSKEIDGRLRPDLDTFVVMPFPRDGIQGARLIGDLTRPDGEPDTNCPRQILRNVARELTDEGLDITIAPEVEFYLFPIDDDGRPSLHPSDDSGYLDFVADQPGQAFRRELVAVMEQVGVTVQHAHHELAPGQHELALQPMKPLECADAIVTLRFMAKALAGGHGLMATFMPKPLYGSAGSGMHLSVYGQKNKKDLFTDESGRMTVEAKYFLGGLLSHSAGMSLLLNPLVNSYKRLVPGHEAPTHVYWSTENIEPYVRVPAGQGRRCLEVRAPDPSCNPYLSIAAVLAAGLDGIRSKTNAGEPINKDIARLSTRERGRLRVRPLPGNLGQAVDQFGKDRFLSQILGQDIARTLMRAKAEEWQDYIRQVHPWELEHYLAIT